ncbi:MAG: ATP-binding cassette domain-containing protein, partial [Actinobacteria bacterium]|nr:ATP-binding cassette domain-containing protein [Actinomycetota bacterium]
MISFDHVSKQYKHGNRPALEEVSFEIAPGEFVFLVGSSGSGKSTLLRLLLHEEVASAGVVQLDGINVGKLRNRKLPAFRRKLGIVFQDFRLLPTKTVFDNIAFGMQVVGKSRKEIR